ncbi:MAG: nuclear transport factor 2 family protein [Myxococcota bacterium]
MIELPKLAILSEEILTSYDGAAPAPARGQLAAIIMKLFHAIALGDFAAAGESLTDDIDFAILASHVAFPVRRAVGREAVLAAFKMNFGVVAEQEHELVWLVEDGARCIMVFHERGRSLALGTAYEGYGTFVFEVRDGRVAMVREITADSAPPRI